MSNDAEYLSISQIAKQLGVSWFTVRRWIENDELPALKLGNQYRVSKKDYEKFLQQRRKQPPVKD
jgi:excisionase family DNA binding protein